MNNPAARISTASAPFAHANALRTIAIKTTSDEPQSYLYCDACNTPAGSICTHVIYVHSHTKERSRLEVLLQVSLDSEHMTLPVFIRVPLAAFRLEGSAGPCIRTCKAGRIRLPLMLRDTGRGRVTWAQQVPWGRARALRGALFVHTDGREDWVLFILPHGVQSTRTR
jgi:hypothetical protein